MKTIKRKMLVIMLSVAVALCGAMTVLTAVTANNIPKASADTTTASTEQSTLLYFGNFEPAILRYTSGSGGYEMDKINVQVYVKKECIDNGGTLTLTFIKGGTFYSLDDGYNSNPYENVLSSSDNYYGYVFVISGGLKAMNIDVQVRVTLSYKGENYIIESNDINLRKLWKNMDEQNLYEEYGFTSGSVYASVRAQFAELFANSYYNGFYEEATSLEYFTVSTSSSEVEYDLLSFDADSLTKYIFKVKSSTLKINPAVDSRYHTAYVTFYSNEVSRLNANNPFDDNWAAILNAFYLDEYVYIQIKDYDALVDMLGGVEKITIQGYSVELKITPTDTYTNNLKTNIENLKTELGITESKCEELKASLSEKDIEIATLKEDITSLNKTIDEKNESIKSLNSQITTLQNDVKTLEATRTTLQKQYNDKVDELTKLQTEYSEYKLTASSKYDDYENQIAALKTERTNLNTQIVELQGDLNIANAKLDTATTNLENKKKELSDLQAEYDAYKKSTGTTNESYEARIATLNNEKTILEGEKYKLENQIITLESDLATANKLNTEKIEKISQLETEYNAYKKSAEEKEADYKSQIQSLTWEKTKLDASVATLTGEIESKDAEITVKQNTIDGLNEEIEYLNGQIEEKQKAYDTVVSAAGSDKADLLNALTSLKTQNEQLDMLNKQLQAENEELKSQQKDETKDSGFEASCTGTIMSAGNIIVFGVAATITIITLLIKARKRRNEND